MSNTSDKMQNRALIMSVLNKYSINPEAPNAKINSDIEQLKSIPDKELLAKVLLKEINDSKTNYANICAIFAVELLDSDIFEKHAIEFLKNKEISDDKKFFIISLLKQKGIEFDYDKLNHYVKHPEKLAQEGVENFLKDALNNPEVQIDLLDFYQNIPKDEKLSLLNNLVYEFEGDNLANALSLISHLDIEPDELEIVISALINSKSPLAKEGLEYILLNKNIDVKSRESAEKSLKELNFKYSSYRNKLIIENSKIYKFYISFVDGNSNFSLAFSRINNLEEIDCSFVTINLLDGIIACMGFGALKKDNFNSIIKRLFADSIPVEINPIALKSILSYYYEKNLKNNTVVPYEFIVWKNLLNDVEKINYDVSEFINSKLETINLNQAKVKKFSCAKILENWFYVKNQNKHIDKLIDLIEKEHITSQEKIDSEISNLVDNYFIEDKKFLLELQSRLLIQAYVAKLAGLKITSAASYSLCFKNPYLKFLITSFVQKSIYYHFRQNLYQRNNSNIFQHNEKTSFTFGELKTLMSNIEEKWK